MNRRSSQQEVLQERVDAFPSTDGNLGECSGNTKIAAKTPAGSRFIESERPFLSRLWRRNDAVGLRTAITPISRNHVTYPILVNKRTITQREAGENKQVTTRIFCGIVFHCLFYM